VPKTKTKTKSRHCDYGAIERGTLTDHSWNPTEDGKSNVDTEIRSTAILYDFTRVSKRRSFPVMMSRGELGELTEEYGQRWQEDGEDVEECIRL
jgi:hypothetical protein